MSNIVEFGWEGVVAAVDVTKILESHTSGREDRVLDGGDEILGVAQARVSNAGVRQASASYNDRTPRMRDASFTAFGRLVLRCHERHEEGSL